ncbi:MAG: glycosyltransferase [Oscillospiraceae bacterium]|nr:glycosyltransferase [Oscillospiraceae bacterium]
MENKACLVSILCTAYNHEAYLRDALDGFLMQKTDFPFEILVSDDASTDSTAAIIREYAAKYPDIVRPFLLTENLFSRGGNLYTDVLYPNMRGKYAAFCEGDDYWTDPEKLQRQVDFLEAHPDYSACVHNTMLHYCDADRADRPLLPARGDRDVALKTLLSGSSYSFHTSSLLARVALIREPPDYYRVAQANGFLDYALNLLLGVSGRIRFLDRVMSVYRIGSNPAAWSAGVDGQNREYRKLRRFVAGERDTLRAFLPHVSGEDAALVEQEILEKEFELMYIEGRDREQRRGPYARIMKSKPLKYRAVNLIKCCLPGLARRYRRRRGFTD